MSITEPKLRGYLAEPWADAACSVVRSASHAHSLSHGKERFEETELPSVITKAFPSWCINTALWWSSTTLFRSRHQYHNIIWLPVCVADHQWGKDGGWNVDLGFKCQHAVWHNYSTLRTWIQGGTCGIRLVSFWLLGPFRKVTSVQKAKVPGPVSRMSHCWFTE